ncbi:thioredoxin family protein [Geothrix sp. PMB-07]|uniref:thioredoxin family protein n=1 Tax=Geothrix sp. PMB-07 TaxID=3068640 RepID=UPI00274219B5|nr:thioredoxin family protein [Geothrix sp. PMB-07]WLT33211.1 thioredoxin family protein [Geothrix sp. PMB-07]
MKPVFPALGALPLGTLVAMAQTPVGVASPPGKLPAGPLLDTRDSKALLLGETTAQAILAHRTVFRDNLAKLRLSDELKARWKAVQRPFTLVAVFGSWCGDSHRELPELLALEAEPNPFIEVHYLGVNRDKVLSPKAWPKGCLSQGVDRVPTFFLFATRPGGTQRLVGAVVETPPKKGQPMAEALVELLEAGLRSN